MTEIIFISCAITILIMVSMYEMKLSNLRKDNKNLESMIRKLSKAGDGLIVNYKTLLKVAMEKFTEKDLEEKFESERKLMFEEYHSEKEKRVE